MAAAIDYDPEINRLVLTFDYDTVQVAAIRGVQGRKYITPERGGPAWRLPASLANAEFCRRIFGPKMVLTQRAWDWGIAEKERLANLLSVHGADDAELKILPKANPELMKFIEDSDPPRPYQRADIAFMAQASCINANEPSLGKTIETIGAIFESGLAAGAHLVVAPVSTLDDTWRRELTRFCDDDMHIWIAHDTTRNLVLNKAAKSDEAFVVITNPDTVRRYTEKLAAIAWDTVTVDEFHLSGLSSPKNAGGGKGTAFFKAIQQLEYKRFWGLSGTPIGGKPVRLWPLLHIFAPEQFGSKWNWADRWLEVDIGYQGHRIVQGIKEDLVDQFYEAHRPYLIRRTKAEVRKQLPPKIPREVWCTMTPTQEKQYKAMATETEIRIDEENLSATNVLALYTRLKQFATARQEIVKIIQREGHDFPSLVLQPTYDSGKLPMLMENLLERGIGPENEGDAQVIIGSQFRPWCEVLAKYLTEEQKVPNVRLITGKVKSLDRKEALDMYRSGKCRVLVVQTQTGGVGLNLDMTESVHVMDETWNPDDQTQLEDRGHRFTGLTVYTYRTRASIEEYIQRIGVGKREINRTILDLRRKGVVHG
jgi:SNF2 family DNA or RNA helicase